MQIRRSAVACLALAAWACGTSQAQTVERPYKIPLVGPYRLYAPRDETRTYLTYQTRGVGLPGNHEVFRVRITGSVAFGRGPKGYFVVAPGENEAHVLRWVDTEEEWKEILQERGIEDIGGLQTPDDIFRGLPRHVREPGSFYIMRNLGGLSDEEWGFLVVALGLLCSIPLGLIIHNQWLRLASVAGVTGLCAVIGPVIIGHGGPGAGVGLIFWPFFALMLAGIARALWRGME
jgi:hypothetical protein